MNALHQAKTVYQNNSQPIRTSRGIEYDVFARLTHRLKAAGEGGPAKSRDLVSALHDNRNLWNTLATDVAGDGNGLPKDLRTRILYLAEFTRGHSSRVLNGAPVQPLIEINKAIMRGLQAESVDR